MPSTANSTLASHLTLALGRAGLDLASNSSQTDLTVSIDTSTPLGLYLVNVNGTSGPLTHSTTLSIAVEADFKMSASPTTISTNIGASTTSTITVEAVNGFTGTVSLSHPFFYNPAVSCNIDPFSVTLTSDITSASSTLTCSATSTGTFTGTIDGFHLPGLYHFVTITLIVTAPEQPNFGLTATSPDSVQTGVKATSTIAMIPTSGFIGTVNLSDSPLPSGLTCTPISPATVSDTSRTATISCSSTNPGTYNVTVMGTIGYVARTTSFTVTVTASPGAHQATILGLSPTSFYAIIGAMAVIIVIATVRLLLRRQKTILPAAAPAYRSPETGPSTRHQPPSQSVA